ncbi:hypothetical protein COCC4DRAFT_54915 [Bipolaris maydis ATCC 48331]|uniref:Uncharacterized protein n=1 Tax=Cochliobolus heterostrophus (strain C4 / ATCC 48331 / race T) TaxID=665024 RepID=N4WE03_COCH4|nr:uncharacterized protein COCC4DRAFT_54915 [Bipolaris maydis ATCC 48331]ENH98488.1 hypothetical protein COCC4DRAFT_54915 [Bipolaris maydis ATCC 48331]
MVTTRVELATLADLGIFSEKKEQDLAAPCPHLNSDEMMDVKSRCWNKEELC